MIRFLWFILTGSLGLLMLALVCLFPEFVDTFGSVKIILFILLCVSLILISMVGCSIFARDIKGKDLR